MNVRVTVDVEFVKIVVMAIEGVGVKPGAPVEVCPGGGAVVRVAAGLVSDGYEELAEILAAAANTSSWGSRAR